MTYIPVLPMQAANKIRALDPSLTDTYGWPQFVTEVVQATKTLPAGVPIFTSDYGEVGALTIGLTAADLAPICGKVTQLGRYTLPDGLHNDELDRGAPFYLCQDPRATWAQLQPSVEHFD